MEITINKLNIRVHLPPKMQKHPPNLSEKEMPKLQLMLKKARDLHKELKELMSTVNTIPKLISDGEMKMEKRWEVNKNTI